MRNGATRLRAHLSRANPQWRHLQDGALVLVVFQGDDTYVTPSWYQSKAEHGKVVPTWNYAMVQARGTASGAREPRVARQIRLVNSPTGMKRVGTEPWKVGDAPEKFRPVRNCAGLSASTSR
jgi:transcriptional regulator